MLMASSAVGQECASRFPAFSGYLHTKGAGWEVGVWPAKNGGFGIVGGIEVHLEKIDQFNPVTKQQDRKTVLESQFFSKGIFRIHRNVYLVGSAGLRDLNKGVFSAGMRLVAPIRNNKYAFWLEPQYGTFGFNTLLAFSIPLN